MLLILLLSILIIVLAILFFKSKNKFIKIISGCAVIISIVIYCVLMSTVIKQGNTYLEHMEYNNRQTDVNMIIK